MKNQFQRLTRESPCEQSRGHSAAVCDSPAPHMPPPLDGFVARAPRNDGAADVRGARVFSSGDLFEKLAVRLAPR